MSDERPSYPYVYRWRKWHPSRYGQRCRVWARGTRNTVGLVFEDGWLLIKSGWAIRRRRGGDGP